MFAAEAGLPTAARPAARVLLWFAACAVLCPLVSMLVWLVGPHAWHAVVVASNAATVALGWMFEGVRGSPGHVAEAISMVLAAALAALGPTLVMALPGAEDAEEGSLAALYPAWIAVMIAPVVLVHGHAPGLGDGRIPSYVSADFLVLFSAASVSVALAYALWVRLRRVGARAETAPQA